MNTAVVGIAWYKKEQWEEFRRLSADGIERTFEEWEKNARKLCQRAEKDGVVVKRVPVDVSDLALWCRSIGRPCTQKTRAQYVALKVK